MNKIAQGVDIKTFFFNGGQTGPSQTAFQSLTGIGSLVSLFLNIAFVIAGVILVFYFIMGGVGMIGSAGQNDPQKLEQAKKTLTSALIGLVIVFAAYYIVQLIASLFGLQGASVFSQLFKTP